MTKIGKKKTAASCHERRMTWTLKVQHVKKYKDGHGEAILSRSDTACARKPINYSKFQTAKIDDV